MSTADAMQDEYDAIAQSGIVFQVDCPDLAMGRHIQFSDADLEGFRRQAQMNVEALNHAVRNIPPNQMRMIPGVIDSTNNYIEHPELIAQRIVRYARLVGQENVIAGTDCGFGTGAGMALVDPKIAWAKFQAMTEGARLATQELRVPVHA